MWQSGSHPTMIRRSALVQQLNVRKDPNFAASSTNQKIIIIINSMHTTQFEPLLFDAWRRLGFPLFCRD